MNTKAVLEFWFGAAAHSAAEVRAAKKRWYRSGHLLDSEIKHRFFLDHVDAQAPVPKDARSDAQCVLARIVLLDQFSRHIYRGQPRAYSFDSIAQDLALSVRWPSLKLPLSPIHKVFALHPFHHAESRPLQRKGIEQLTQIMHDADQPWHPVLKGFLKSFEDHALIIERFGRFPHRNHILERPSTAAEIDYMTVSKHNFGQAHGYH